MCDENLYTPLLTAAANERLDVCRSLLDTKVNLSAVTSQGATILHFLSRISPPENQIFALVDLVGLCILKGANVNAQNHHGETPLHYAVLRGPAEVLITLVQAEANVNIVNSLGESPLHVSLRRNDPKLIRLLLQNGADPHLRSDMGTVFQIAESKHNVEIISLLSDYYEPSKIRDKSPVVRPRSPGRLSDKGRAGTTKLRSVSPGPAEIFLGVPGRSRTFEAPKQKKRPASTSYSKREVEYSDWDTEWSQDAPEAIKTMETNTSSSAEENLRVEFYRHLQILSPITLYTFYKKLDDEMQFQFLVQHFFLHTGQCERMLSETDMQTLIWINRLIEGDYPQNEEEEQFQNLYRVLSNDYAPPLGGFWAFVRALEDTIKQIWYIWATDGIIGLIDRTLSQQQLSTASVAGGGLGLIRLSITDPRMIASCVIDVSGFHHYRLPVSNFHPETFRDALKALLKAASLNLQNNSKKTIREYEMCILSVREQMKSRHQSFKGTYHEQKTKYLFPCAGCGSPLDTPWILSPCGHVTCGDCATKEKCFCGLNIRDGIEIVLY
eukprot:TRINITY_DN733_c1_g3_i1.p1 TRINITY_DN733_c1_g3~~TRINITY_DN733_c1_g3_i1.p1  ORF type:complete len:604 (-),score=138.85 TRINITY_DN733_c1_g3_i1:251-1909(-)